MCSTACSSASWTAAKATVLRESLRQLINKDEDQVLMVDLGPATLDVLATMDVLGQPYAPPGRRFVV